MKTVNVPREPVTLERLERGLAIAAYIVMQRGAIAVPLFEKLERELAIMKSDQDAVLRAGRLLEILQVGRRAVSYRRVKP